jgi:hypothetical protein
MLDAEDCRTCHTEHLGPQGALTQVTRIEVDHVGFGFSLAAHITTADNREFVCADCHTQSLARFAPARCEDCHRSYEDPFVTTHVREFGSACRDCHDGSDSFSQDTFDHNQLAHPLLGKHAQVPCVECHADVRDLEGFKDAPTDCVGCHQEANEHPATFGTDCARCHNTEGWETEIFNHNLSIFKLVGKHAEVACAQCHVAGVHQGTPQECVACHVQENPHSLMLGGNCAQCHTPEDWKSVTFDHNQTDFGLTGKHSEVPCAECHVDDIFVGTPQTCFGCHAQDDVHRGLLGSYCAACHTTETWQRGPFEHTFPLDHGGQGIIACTTCHTVPGDYTAYTCYNCHNPDDIRRQHPFAQLMGTDITNCVRCHPTGRQTMQMH